MKRTILFLTFAILISTLSITAQEERFQKILEDDNSKFTDVGNIAITVTNFGVYGHAFSLWPQQPNCEYPIGSGIEHIYDGGLWIGGFKADFLTQLLFLIKIFTWNSPTQTKPVQMVKLLLPTILMELL